jgi:hypothetical protein
MRLEPRQPGESLEPPRSVPRRWPVSPDGTRRSALDHDAASKGRYYLVLNRHRNDLNDPNLMVLIAS